MDKLTYYRTQINQIDGEIRALLYQRMQLVRKIGAWKESQNIPFYDAARENAILQAVAEGLPIPEGDAMQEIWNVIFQACRKIRFMHPESERQ